MKVLLINHFPLDGSGSGTYTRSIAEYLVKRGHEVHIIFPENALPTEIPGVYLHPIFFTGDTPLPNALPFNFPCFTTHPRSLTTFASLNPQERELYLNAFDRAICEEVEQFQPDIIHAQHIWWLAALGTKHNCPCVVTTHGTDLMGCKKWPELRQLAAEAVQNCDQIIAISRDNLVELTEEFPNAAQKTILLLNGYNEDIFYPEDADRTELFAELGIPYHGEQVVLFAGKLTAFKGTDTLLQAAQQYEQLAANNVVTLIAGSGEKDTELRELADKLQLQSIHFLGHKNQAELRHLYSCADVLAMPSRREPFGLVALEALACGTAVIATNQGGLPEFVKPEVGALVPVDDPDALCSAIMQELARSKNENRRETIAHYAQNFTQSKFIDHLENIYAALVKAAKGNEEK